MQSVQEATQGGFPERTWESRARGYIEGSFILATSDCKFCLLELGSCLGKLQLHGGLKTFHRQWVNVSWNTAMARNMQRLSLDPYNQECQAENGKWCWFRLRACVCSTTSCRSLGCWSRWQGRKQHFIFPVVNLLMVESVARGRALGCIHLWSDHSCVFVHCCPHFRKDMEIMSTERGREFKRGSQVSPETEKQVIIWSLRSST